MIAIAQPRSEINSQVTGALGPQKWTLFEMGRLTLSAPKVKLMGNHSGSLRLLLKQPFCTLLAERISDRGQGKLKNANIKMEIVRSGERKKLNL